MLLLHIHLQRQPVNFFYNILGGEEHNVYCLLTCLFIKVHLFRKSHMPPTSSITFILIIIIMVILRCYFSGELIALS